MDDREIQRLRAEERTYWWHISRRLMLQSVLVRHAEFISASPRKILKRVQDDGGGTVQDDGRAQDQNDQKTKILDVGCGTGENFQWLGEFGKVVGVDTSELAIELSSQKGTAVLGRAEDLPFEDGEFNLVTAFDVLEHVTDETRVLGEWKRVLHSGGLLFISVPAYQWLFGPHDRALAHLRRYNLLQLKKILENNRFSIIFASYIFCLTFPTFLIQRWLARSSMATKSQYVAVPSWLNYILIGLGKVEAGWLKFGKFSFGSSIVVLVRKL